LISYRVNNYELSTINYELFHQILTKEVAARDSSPSPLPIFNFNWAV